MLICRQALLDIGGEVTKRYHEDINEWVKKYVVLEGVPALPSQ